MYFYLYIKTFGLNMLVETFGLLIAEPLALDGLVF